MRVQDGFTLVELLTALGVAAVLLGMGVPSYRQLARDNQFITSANDLVLAAMLARSEAAKRGVPITIAAAAGGGTANEFGNGWSVFVDTDTDGVLDGGETVLYSGESRTGGQTVDSVENVNFVQYRPWGNLSVAPALRQFDVCMTGIAGERGRRVTIWTTGGVSVTTITCT